MRKTIYFLRHSIVEKNINSDFNNDSLQLVNEKSILSEEGEELAKNVAKLPEFENIDCVISSGYVRAISTAKYFAKNSGCKVVVNNLFNERKHGVSKWSELPDGFEAKQFRNWDFKMPFGESLNEVKSRMDNGLQWIFNNCEGNVLVVSHATALTTLFSNWCEINYGECGKFNDKVILRNWDYMESFKLEFEDGKLINMTNVGINTNFD